MIDVIIGFASSYADVLSGMTILFPDFTVFSICSLLQVDDFF
jgi:hypothetical protein